MSSKSSQPSRPAASAKPKGPAPTIHRLQFACFVCYFTYSLCFIRYMLSVAVFDWNSTIPAFCYYIAMLCATTSHGIVTYKTVSTALRRRLTTSQVAMLIASNDTSHYLILACVWLVSRQNPLAPLSFAVYAAYHTVSYLYMTLIPLYFPGSAQTLIDTLAKYSQDPYHTVYMKTAAIFEILAWFPVLFRALGLNIGSIFVLIIYTAFLRVRYHSQQHTVTAYRQLARRITGLLANAPPAVNSAWIFIQDSLAQFEQMTKATVNRLNPPVSATRSSN